MSSLSQFRDEYRAAQIGPRYVGALHFAFTTGVCALIIAGCLMQLDQVSLLEGLTVPVTFLFANFVEHYGHRHPMHHPVRGLGLLFERHTRQHHRFFVPGHMSYDSPRDYKAVLFPPVMILFFFGVFALPVGLLLAFVASANVAWLFVATSVGYFLNYELFHFAYHMHDQAWVWRVPGLRRLRALHHAHHDPKLMSHYNFNITYPIADWVHGTWYRASRDQPQASGARHSP